MSDPVFAFRPAVRERVSLLVGIAGASGAGKTYSALRLAKGLSPEGKIIGVDTEAGRMLHYADQFTFLHGDMRPPFEPERYIEAILAAEQAGAEVVVVDSMSHEWLGEGGCHDLHDAIARKMATRDGKFDPGRYEAMSGPAWREPKMRHKRMVSRLLQCRAHLIFCLRAEEKVRFRVIEDQRDGRTYKRTVIEPMGWMPIAEKSFIFEMTLSFTLAPDSPGLPRFDLPHKLQEQHRPFFPEGRQIGEKAGAALREWAAGGAVQPKRTFGAVLTELKQRLERAPTRMDVADIAGDPDADLIFSTASQRVRDELTAALADAYKRFPEDDGEIAA